MSKKWIWWEKCSNVKENKVRKGKKRQKKNRRENGNKGINREGKMTKETRGEYEKKQMYHVQGQIPWDGCCQCISKMHQ